MELVIANKNELIRLGLERWVRPIEDVEFVGGAGNLDDLVALLEERRPGMALVDLDLPGLAEDRFIAPLREVVPDLKVIVASESTTDSAVTRAFRSFADGFVAMDDIGEMLPMALWSVKRGGTFVDPAVGHILIAQLVKGRRDYAGRFGMTFQEQRVAGLLTQRLTNREIAEQLGITPGTVKTHVGNVVEKVGGQDRYEAADIIEREGITSPWAKTHDD